MRTMASRMSARYSCCPRSDMHNRSLDVFRDLGHPNAVDSSRRQDVHLSVEELLEEALQANEMVVGRCGELHDEVQIARIRLSALGIRAKERDAADAKALQLEPMPLQGLKDVRFRHDFSIGQTRKEHPSCRGNPGRLGWLSCHIVAENEHFATTPCLTSRVSEVKVPLRENSTGEWQHVRAVLTVEDRSQLRVPPIERRALLGVIGVPI